MICKYAFDSCVRLSKVIFEKGSQLRCIGRAAFGGCSLLRTICIPASIESLERKWFVDSIVYGGDIFDIVRFESAESLAKMIAGDCADLSGDFDIEVLNWRGDTPIPGYCVDTVHPGSLARLRKLSEAVIVTARADGD
jgi:hypothetical protein